MADSKSDMLQGTLDLLILRVLDAGGSMHGWAVAQRLQQVSQEAFVLNQGSLYPALHRLEAQGWIEAEWGVSEKGRQAKFYNLTRSGRRQLELETASWQKFAAAVGLVLKTG